MTSPTNPVSAQQDLKDRSVRDVVEYSPGEVNDAWCRNILRKILQSIELQYAMQMPHRAITPDTIVLHANGEPLLISDDIDAVPAPAAQQAADLTALARVIHYAITQELAPAGPLDGRADGYSAALVATVDACMDPDSARRPRSVDAVRGLLDAGAPPIPSLPVSASAPAFTPAPVDRAMPEAAHRAGMRRGQRWAIAAGIGAIALALVWFVALRDTGPTDHIVLTPPHTGAAAHPDLPAPVVAPSVGTVAMDARADQAAVATARDPASDTVTNVAGDLPTSTASDPAGSAASGASSGGTTASGGEQRDEAILVAPDLSSAAESVAATEPPAVSARAAAAAPANGKTAARSRANVPPSTVSGNASYQLQIKPWGNVYVDGVDRGVSPPIKSVTLTPGRHTIRIANPKYRDSILEFDSAPTTSNGKIIVDFNRDAQ